MQVRESEKAAAAYHLMKQIGLAQVAGLAVYVLLVELLPMGRGDALWPNADLELIRTSLLLISIITAFLTGRVRNRLLARASVEEALVPGARLKRMTVANIVAFALCDVIALFGLVLFLIGGARQDFYLFAILAFVSFLIYFPRPGQWHAWYAVRGQMR